MCDWFIYYSMDNSCLNAFTHIIICVIVTFELNKLRKEHNDFSKEIGRKIKESKG